LALATSADGLRWHRRRVVEFEAGGEFSYPALLVAGDDEIHLSYTWQRKHIRHLRFNRGWLEPGAQEVAK
jgi:alpha-L-fucosidase